MRKIYMLTLDDEIPLPESVNSDIREIAYLLYSELGTYEKTILCSPNNGLNNFMLNELHDINNGMRYEYKFTSDYQNIDYRYFEPFVIDNKSFGFTVYDNSINDNEILSILNYILRITNLNYHFNISSITYDENKKNGRFQAINMLVSSNKEIIVKKYTKKKNAQFLRKIASML